MRVFVTWLVALGMIVSPAMAGTDRPGDDKDTTPKNGAASATAEKDKTADATANHRKAKRGSGNAFQLGDRDSTTSRSHRDSIQVAPSAERTTERTAAQDAVAGKRSKFQQQSRTHSPPQ